MIDTGNEVGRWDGEEEGAVGRQENEDSQKTVGMGGVVVGRCGWAGGTEQGTRREIQERNLICDRSDGVRVF